MTHRWPYLLAVLVMAVAVGSRFLPAVSSEWDAPHDLSFERPQVSLVELIDQGVNVYSPSVYAELPFNTNIYTPAYHYLVSWLPQIGENVYLRGRLVSAVFMLCAAGLLLFRAGTRSGLVAGVLALLTFLSIPAVASSTAFARMDSMALFFAAASVVLIGARRTRATLALAALLAQMAIFTKQSYVSAAAAAVLYLLWTDGKAARIYVLASALVGSVLYASAHLLWGPGFWWSVLSATSKEMEWSALRSLWKVALLQWAYVFFLVVLAVWWIGDLLGMSRRRRAPDNPFFLYVPLTFLILMFTLGKRGAGLNYFFEPTLAGLLYLVWRCASYGDALLEKRVFAAACAVLVALTCIDVARLPFARYSRASADINARQRSYLAQLRGELDSLDPDATRIYFDLTVENPSLSLGKPLYVNDPIHYALMEIEGRMPPDPFIAAFQNRFFEIVVLPLRTREDRFAALGPVQAAIVKNYHLAKRGLHQYWVPRPGIPPHG